MSSQRIQRVNEMIRREIAMAIPGMFTGEPVDIAAITVTHVDTTPNLRQADVYISILHHEEERAGILRAFKRHRVELQSCISKNMVLKYTPRLKFILDESLEKGDRILHLLDELDESKPADEDSV